MKIFHVDFVLVHDAKGGQRMKTSWYSDNASVEEIVKVLKQYPSYKTSFLEDIVSQKEKIFLNNPTEVDGSEELFERLYEIAELPNRILSGYTYRNIFYVLKNLKSKKKIWWSYMKTILVVQDQYGWSKSLMVQQLSQNSMDHIWLFSLTKNRRVANPSVFQIILIHII